MALQVWLPLNKEGDFQNRGLANITVTNNGATYNSSGKIGGCYVGSCASRQWMYAEYSGGTSEFMTKFINNHSFTLAAWAKTSSQTALLCITYGVGLFSNHFTLYRSSGSQTCWNDLGFDGNWHHYCGTYDVTTGKMTFYIDGVQVSTSTIENYESSWTNATIGIGRDFNDSTADASHFIEGSISDVRIYDHCLSPKEVKEISKALVLHYPLNDAYVEGTTNECNDITWTAYNSANGKYGYDAESNIAQTTGTFQGRKCTKVYPVANGSGFYPYSYIPAFVSDGGNYPKIKTVSFDYYSPCATYIEPYKLGSGQATITYKVKNSLGISTGSGANDIGISVVQNEWNHVEFTVTATTSAAAEWGYVVNGSKVTASDNTYYLYANVQVESKDHATPFTSSTRTATTVYDCSGYSNNGTIKGSLSCVDDSPRYNVSTYFSANTNQIVLPYINYSGFGNSYTISWWAKGNPQMMWGFANGNRLNIPYAGFYANTGDGSSNPFYTPGTTTTITNPISTTEFKHYVAVGDGSTLKLYVNGAHYGTAKTYKALTGTQIYINGWSSSGDYGGVEYISDFRIYATALSADDIKELYNTSAIVCNNGAMLAYELEE